MGNLKGTYVGATVKALRARREQAQTALAPELHHYLDGNILSSRWYPESEHFELLKALVEISRIDAPDPYASIGALAAKRDMTSTYKAFLREGDPGATFERLGSVWSLGHDGGEMKVEVAGSSRGVLELRDYGFCEPEICRLNTAFFVQTLEMAGAQGVEMDHTRCVALGDDCCRWESNWGRP